MVLFQVLLYHSQFNSINKLIDYNKQNKIYYLIFIDFHNNTNVCILCINAINYREKLQSAQIICVRKVAPIWNWSTYYKYFIIFVVYKRAPWICKIVNVLVPNHLKTFQKLKDSIELFLNIIVFLTSLSMRYSIIVAIFASLQIPKPDCRAWQVSCCFLF